MTATALRTTASDAAGTDAARTDAAGADALPDLRGLPAGTVVVHGGMHKTGSSALQNALAASAPALRQAGWLYPDAGLVEQDDIGRRHLWLMAELRDRTEPAAHWAQLRRELDAWDGRVLLSHENLLSPEVDPAALVSALGGRPVVLLAWVRHPVDYLESCYREWTRRWGWGVPPSRFAQVRAPWLDVPALVRGWDDVLGADRVVLRPYDRDRLVGGSTVDDALAVLGLPADLARAGGPAHGNDSISTRQLLVHRVANQLGVPAGDEMRALVTALLADAGSRAAALAGLPTAPGGGWSAARLAGLRAVLGTPFPERGRVLDDALVAAVEQQHLPLLQALLAARGVPALGPSVYGAAPLDTSYADPRLEACTAALWR